MLHVHRAERADRLADGLAETLLAPLDDPFSPDVVAVPTRGIERWLTQRLSTRLGTSGGRHDGVCANVEFPFPGRLIQGALAAATGLDPENDPWVAERSVWPLLEVVDECLGEPWLATLARHLDGARGDPEDPMRRFGAVRHIADLFDRYAVHRPDMVRSWVAQANGNPGDWQPELWRRLRERIGVESPAERLAPACERIRNDAGLLDLPVRLSLFGLTRIPRSYLDALAAIAVQRDLHLFVLHPSPSLWQTVAAELKTGPLITERGDDRTAPKPANRLLASWGRDVRELQLVVAGAGESLDHHHGLPATQPQTLLATIQRDIREDRRPPGPPLPGEPDGRATLHPDDRTVQIHACHGRARQVEVLRDVVLHLLEDDPTLEPRDVIVMCPDIETFAPLIQATFGSGRRADEDEDEDEPDDVHERLPDLRVRLADRSLRQTNPVLSVVSQVLALADQRATASQLLDLAGRDPVRRRFGFDDDDLSRMQEWVAESGIRWGFDAAHREPFKLGSLHANTWRRGLDRMLVGVAMTEEDSRLVQGVLPLDDVDSGAIDLAGRFAEFVDRAKEAADSLTEPKPIADWIDAIAHAADSLTATSERESWQRRELQRLLGDVDAESRGASEGGGPELELADVRVLLADRLRGRPTRANFRTGHLTVCTLVPMRSVPHRVVFVLGLDDGEFPRRTRRDGDDLLLAEPHVGDRDPRAEDRQMLLDALMAATERLIITYSGADERTNLRRPPAVPVGELLDIVDRTVRSEHGSLRDQVVFRHPLQPFDPRNFVAGKLVPGRPWSFDPHALAGAKTLEGRRKPDEPFLPAPLAPRSDAVIELDNLVRFVEAPVRAFLRDRLGISVSEFFDEVEDELPVELDALGKWSVGQRLLDGVLAGADLDACKNAEIARGTLPPGHLALPVLEEIGAVVARLAAAAKGLVGDEPPGSLDVNLLLPDGRTLAGTVTGVCGDRLRAISYSRVRPRVRLRTWVKLLSLTAARPERPFESLVIGRARAGAYQADVCVARILPIGDDAAARGRAALEQLAILIDLYDRGMREPLPLSSDASAAYAEAAVAGHDGADAADKAWTSTFDYPKEDRQPEHLLVYGGEIPLSDLMATAPHADENWHPDEASRFGVYARRLWNGLIAREEIGDR
jgi:exodeoxyribonuclease V gamma subunit